MYWKNGSNLWKNALKVVEEQVTPLEELTQSAGKNGSNFRKKSPILCVRKFKRFESLRV